MSELAIAISLGLPLSALLLWILLSGRRSLGHANSVKNLQMKAVLPRHYRYFPQIRQALSAADEKYLLAVAPPQVAREAVRQRREVARKFLQGLREDFTSLEQLARMVASLSPVISREQEMQRLLLVLQFHVLFTLVRLRILTGRVPLAQIQNLTELVGRLTMRMEQTMTAIAELSTNQVSSEVAS
jgi:hypothetical protein